MQNNVVLKCYPRVAEYTPVTTFINLVSNSVQEYCQSIIEAYSKNIKATSKTNFLVYPQYETNKNTTTSQNIVLMEGTSCGKMNADVARRRNMEKLDQMSRFDVNWNGYGAKPIAPSVIKKMRDLLPELHVQPEIFPTACNAIQFEYEKPDGDYLEFMISENEVSVFRMDPYGHESKHAISGTPEEINKVVRDFYGICSF